MDEEGISLFAWWFFKGGIEQACKRLRAKKILKEGEARELEESLKRYHQAWNLIRESSKLHRNFDENWMLDSISSLVVENSVNYAIKKLGGSFSRNTGFKKKLDILFKKAKESGIELDEARWKRSLREKWAGRHLPVHEAYATPSSPESAQESYETVLRWLRDLKKAGLSPISQKIELKKENWKEIKGKGNWKFDKEGYTQASKGACNLSLIKGLKTKNASIELEAKSLDGRGGQHIVWRSDGRVLKEGNCYCFGSINLGQPKPYVHFWIWKEGDRKEIRWESSRVPVDLKPNKFHKYKVEFHDDWFKMYIDDVLISQISDNTHTEEGHLGIHCGSSTTFKNIQVRKPKEIRPEMRIIDWSKPAGRLDEARVIVVGQKAYHMGKPYDSWAKNRNLPIEIGAGEDHRQHLKSIGVECVCDTPPSVEWLESRLGT
ncbi:hypothetical protein AKJ43_01910 [candidate division MSBL1 archaeon SCGC-AAA261D19]|uniref:3-keto-alpha-glucoside-1,2-lyase/3-keto-2-hydroxy-glucal hydratase domain-containing protein n=1 Tax=candidate division MSBL1 archaeon SCGC-AAA261D19 TaxID=1698273 RepID=A0A133V7E3_9EURY|nr:hypothetical protein AKJ43_01910 [candidate division MSBL1 archaeon SCGC-AAA261D19]